MSKKEMRRRICAWREVSESHPNPTNRHEAARFVLYLTAKLERIERAERKAA